MPSPLTGSCGGQALVENTLLTTNCRAAMKKNFFFRLKIRVATDVFAILTIDREHRSFPSFAQKLFTFRARPYLMCMMKIPTRRTFFLEDIVRLSPFLFHGKQNDVWKEFDRVL